MGWLGFWSQIVACGTALISGHVADKLIGHFKMVLLILLSISTFSFIWMCFICTQVIPFSIGKYTGGGNVWCDIAKYIVKWTQEKWACDSHDDATPLSF